jgi:nucleotide-binding universal stress UspA family protein
MSAAQEQISLLQDQPASLPAVGDNGITRVIVGVDDTVPGLAAVEAAIKLAASHDAKLLAVRAWALGLPRHGGRRMRRLTHPHVVLSFSGAQQSAASQLLVHRAFDAVASGTLGGVQADIQTPACDPALALVGIAGQPGDVLVVGTNPGHPIRRLVHGSVSHYCTRHATCPVLVVPGRAGADRDGRAGVLAH